MGHERCCEGWGSNSALIPLLKAVVSTQSTSLVELATSYFDAGNLDQASDALELVPLETSGAEALRERLGSARPEK